MIFRGSTVHTNTYLKLLVLKRTDKQIRHDDKLNVKTDKQKLIQQKLLF